ncbi:MAG: type II secretion system F family protein [Methanosarcinales archaeon Met12]|nr:MAG: type II secretion system F family protein [Methanosarcinales archaeon Met12]
MDVTFEMYLSTATLYATIIGFVSIVIALMVVHVFWVFDIITVALSMLTGFGLGVLTYLGFLVLPVMRMAQRKRDIDATLPHAINYIAAMAGAGVTPLKIFHSLAKSEVYGELAKEARYVIRDVDLFGRDLNTAIKNVAATTPSQKLQEFLQGVITTSTAGGELEPYFKLKAGAYMTEKRMVQKEFIEKLGIIAETYVTAFVAGPLFLIVILSIMSMMGAEIVLLYLVIYVMIPMGSGIILLMVDMATPRA